MTKSRTNTLFADASPKDLNAKAKELTGAAFEEMLKRMDAPHPFSYIFAQQSTPSPRPQDLSESEKSAQVSVYDQGVDDVALNPDEIVKAYNRYMEGVLDKFCDRDIKYSKLQQSKSMPSFDHLKREATEDRVTQALFNNYSRRYTTPDHQLSYLGKQEQSLPKNAITSLLQSYVFLDQFLWRVLAAVINDFRTNQLNNNISHRLEGSALFNLRKDLKGWLTAIRFDDNIQFNNGNSAFDRRVPVHIVSRDQANLAIKLFLIRRYFAVNQHQGYQNFSENIKFEALKKLVSLIDAQDEHGVGAAIKDEALHAHKSFYAPHELLFIR